jgi:hypothetical protein
MLTGTVPGEQVRIHIIVADSRSGEAIANAEVTVTVM